jgi:GTP-binding protein
LIAVSFVASYPTADFRLDPPRPEICFLGRSNVGKSSLINAVAGRRQLARTSRTPGKTRLCNVYDAGSAYLVDLPGYGYARVGHAQRQGLQRLIRDYLAHRASLAGAVWLLDVRRDPSADDLEVADLLHHRGLPVLVAVTKADKLGRMRRMERTRAILSTVAIPPDQCVITSARTGEGIADLRDSITAFVDVHEA